MIRDAQARAQEALPWRRPRCPRCGARSVGPKLNPGAPRADAWQMGCVFGCVTATADCASIAHKTWAGYCDDMARGLPDPLLEKRDAYHEERAEALRKRAVKARARARADALAEPFNDLTGKRCRAAREEREREEARRHAAHLRRVRQHDHHAASTGDATRYREALADPDALIDLCDAPRVRAVVDALALDSDGERCASGERRAAVLRARFWDGATLQQVADDLGVSRERVRQVELKVLRMLRHSSRAKLLPRPE
jgi:hypothetical protein